MNKLILLILLNVLVYHLYHKNKYLLLALFIFIIYYTLQIRKNIKEGNTEDLYKYRFANSLNSNIKNSRKKDNMYDIIISKLNTFLRIYIDSENIPDEQPCIGIFDKWSKCSVDCGVGEKYRTFHILQPSGKYGINCVYEDGEIDKKYCHKGKCKLNEICDSNEDCSSNYCSPLTNICSIENECNKYQLYNCDFEECQNLGKNYHYDINGNCIDYSERENNRKKNPDIYDIKMGGKKYKLSFNDDLKSIELTINGNIKYTYKYNEIKKESIKNVYKDIEFNVKNKKIKMKSDEASIITINMGQKTKK
jgi:hypothetical protein